MPDSPSRAVTLLGISRTPNRTLWASSKAVSKGSAGGSRRVCGGRDPRHHGGKVEYAAVVRVV